MAKKDIISKLAFLMSVDDMKRVKICNTNNEISIMLDVHGYSCREARRVINSIIAICRIDFILKIIHGYNHGVAIKEMIRQKGFNNRFDSICTANGNQGISIIAIHAA